MSSINPSSVETMRALLELLEAAQLSVAQNTSVQFRRLDFDTSRYTTTAPLVDNTKGFGLVFPAFGAPNGAVLTVVVDGVSVTMLPGSSFNTPFQRLEVYNTAGGVTAGVATLYILTQPTTRLSLGDLQSGYSAGAQRTGIAANITTDLPSLVTDGVPLSGRGARAVVSAQVGQTITGGTGVWWLYDDLSGLWAESAVQVDLTRATARRAVACPDEFTTVGRGRAWLELRSVTVSGGTLSVSLFTN
jgi:hypothetical protein